MFVFIVNAHPVSHLLVNKQCFKRDFKVIFCTVIGEFRSMFCESLILDRCYDNDKCQRVTKSQVWP